MAMIECRECGKDISSKAQACPSCGARRRRPIGSIGFLLAIGLLGAFAVAGMRKTPAPAPLSAAQQAQAEAREIRYLRTAIAAKTLKNNLREPASVEWVSILSNDDATVICLEYRARNGFGGMNSEIAVITPAQASQEAGFWNQHCHGPMNDMLYVRSGI